jgi:tetratricopeptide (TPR) repeat protein
LAHAHWKLVEGRPPKDSERLFAAHGYSQALAHCTDRFEEALQLAEEILAVRRRLKGDQDPQTVIAKGSIAAIHLTMGNYVPALSMYEDVLEGLRLTKGNQHSLTLSVLGNIAEVHRCTGNNALARLFLEEAAEGRQQASSSKATELATEIAQLDKMCKIVLQIGAHREGLEILGKLVESCQRELGNAHPQTLSCKNTLEELSPSLQRELGYLGPENTSFQELLNITNTLAMGVLDGLVNKQELNGQHAWVLGFDSTKQRYRCRCGAPGDGLMQMMIKPANVILRDGTAVTIVGLTQAPDWNGRRVLVGSYDEESGRYRMLLKERKKPLAVRTENCRVGN